MNKTAINKKPAGKILGIALSAAILGSAVTGIGIPLTVSTTADAASVNYVVDDQQNGSILQCFNWSFSEIKNNMGKIASQGFTAIQTSPIQTAKETTAGKTAKGSWWALYQPADFNIETNANGTGALGTATEFRAMCEEAHKYGVRVIVDAVLNHMANIKGNDLSPTIPEKYRNNSNFWHDISKNSWYASRYDITQFCMDGVPDLNTGNTDVQAAAKQFLKECIDCGADGFRFDGAKHIETPVDSTSSDFWPNVLDYTTSYAQQQRGITPYYYGEILDKPTGDNDASDAQKVANWYTQYMSVTMSGVSNDIRNKVNGSDASGAKRSDFNFDGGVASVKGNKAVLWNESHDTYQAGSSRGVSDYNVNKTWALVGTRAQACGMYLARPSNWESAKMGQADVTAWANTEVKAVNDFNNAFVGETEYLSSSGSIAYNERGTSGVVLVNVSGGSTSVSVKANKMTAGTYTDAITGSTFTVSGGNISGNIGSTGIAVVYKAPEKSAEISADPESTSFTADTLGVTISLKNAESGTYSTTEGASGSFANGTAITVGSSIKAGESVTLTLKATGEDGKEVTKTYTYTKKDPSAVTQVVFDNSKTKWANVYAYVFEQGSGEPAIADEIKFSDTLGWGTAYAYFFNDKGTVGAAWPGTKMTSTGTNRYGQDTYKIAVPDGATKIIFNNNNGTQTGNLDLLGVEGFYCDGSASVTKSYGEVKKNVCNAEYPGVNMLLNNSTGYYHYTVPTNLVNGLVVFSDGTSANRYPATDAAALEINDTAMILSSDNTWKPYTGQVDYKLTNNSTVSATTVEKGMPVVITGSAIGGKAPYKYFFRYKKSTDDIYIQLGEGFTSTSKATFYPHVAGTFIAEVQIKDANGTVAKKSLKVKATPSDYGFENKSKLNASTISVGSYFKMSGVASGGKAPYSYTFMFKRAGNTKWNIIGTEWGTKTSATLTPNSEAEYDMRVLIKDASGRVATKSFRGTAKKGGELTSTSSISSYSITLGNSIKLNGSAYGGAAPYTYAFYFKKAANTTWKTIGTEFSTKTSATLTPTAKGTYDLKISVRDNSGKVITDQFQAKVI